MARVSGVRAPAFTLEELEKLVHATLRSSRQTGQRLPEEGYLACHRQGRLDAGGPPLTEHPLTEKMGGHSPLEQEDGRGPLGDGLLTLEGCLSHHDPLMYRILAVAYPE
ncbi:hypothetical protein NDU88_007630 [Pleurodeles waltl]|uniref:Uncharacterized protein n=1 Tax=Pleurodeles waltl TaxID=8319 RepID=A0AAV7N5X4_PLEWA|nr:hypothetical protein NDU88_007630 [Pleurodeles waltl]